MMTMAFAPVGNLGNAADTTGYGVVGYAYSIGKYEVTLAQYTEFLNNVLTLKPAPAQDYLSSLYSAFYMDNNKKFQDTIARTGTGTTNDPFKYTVDPESSPHDPVPWVSWYSAARFVNWLHNGATPTASTETGAYQLNGAMTGTFTHTADAKFWLPTENEWYKAAYYDPQLNGGAGGYWAMPTANNTYPDATTPPGSMNAANYNDVLPRNDKLTDAGAYTFSPSGYGTYDQAGNLWEFLEASFHGNNMVRGGSWSYGFTPIDKTTRRDYVSQYLDDDTGFRIASATSSYAVPTQSSGLVSHYAITGYEQISSLYLGLLNREADGPGYQGWLNQLGAQKPENALATWRSIADQIANTAEAGKAYAALANPKSATQQDIETFVNGVYESLFARKADAAGLAGWSGLFKAKADAGVPVGSIIVDMAAATYNLAAASDHQALVKNAALGIPEAYPLTPQVTLLGLPEPDLTFL